MFFPDTTGSGANKCTFRRALREAGAIANDDFCAGCGPVTIVFSGLNGINGDGDDVQFNNGQWVLPVSDAGDTSDFGLFPQTITNVIGEVTIRGPLVDVQGNNEMPGVMIESGKTMEIELSDVNIRNLGFYGGMSIFAKEENITFENNTWGLAPNGMAMVFADTEFNIDVLAGNNGILSTIKGDNLLVQNNIITGAGTYAVEVNSATTGVQVLGNWIGTNVNGEVPMVPDQFKCRTFTTISPDFEDLDPSEWFGGAGISAAGTGLIIENNVIVGLQSIRTANQTPPLALEMLGRMNVIENNVIGQDVNGMSVGVCGQGIKISTQRENPVQQNNGHLVVNNIIDSSRDGFDGSSAAILWTDTTVNLFLDGGNTVRGNLVVNGPERYFQMGPLLTTPMRTFEPAEITSISGTTVIGGSDTANITGGSSPCPDCIIDFYLDDDDANEEALEYLGSTLSDNNGDFTFVMLDPLPNGFGIRTTSTSMADNVIPNTWAGQTSEMSNVVYGLPNDIIFKDGFE